MIRHIKTGGSTKQNVQRFALVLAVAVCGTVLLQATRAANLSANLEPESGARVSPAITGTDSTASNGQYVKFGEVSSGGTSYTPPGMRVLPDPLYGVTLDDVSGASTNRINAELTSMKALPRKVIARVVFDEGTSPSDYTTQIRQMQPDVYIMGELSDSLYMEQQTVQQYTTRASQFVAAMGNDVDLWEVGNEVNGDWTGSYTDVAAKITGAHNAVKAAGKRSELTLWYNPNCASSSRELDPVAFSNQYLSSAVRNSLDYVTISYYQTQCNDYVPSVATLKTVFTQLHALYPNARLGFGEIGLPDPVTSSTTAKAQSIASYYYGLNLDLPYYIGGYFYWYYAQDAVPSTKPLWTTISNGMTKY